MREINPISLGCSVIPTAQKQRESMTCPGNCKELSTVRGQLTLRDDTGAMGMAQIVKSLVGFRTFFLVSYFNQGVRHDQGFGLRKITLAAV